MMTPYEERAFRQMYSALKRITKYDSTDRLRRDGEESWGVPFAEALEMAYENLQSEARAGLSGVRQPRQPQSEAGDAVKEPRE